MKISVITVNYNNSAGLEKTIRSIICQNYSDFEYIVIDGDSTDGSKNIIEKYSDKISWWLSEPDSGVYNAMNKGIRAAKGEYLLFINSGDYLTEDADLSNISLHLETGEDLVYFNLRLLFPTGEIKVKSYPYHPDFKYFTVETLPHPATFIKRQLFSDLGLYNENMKICADWEFFIKAVCLQNCTYKYVSDSFSLFCLDGMSYDPVNKQVIYQEKLSVIHQYFPLYQTLFEEWYERGILVNRIRNEKIIKALKKFGFLKWI